MAKREIKPVETIYEVTSRQTIGKGITRTEEVKIRVWLHDGYIEIIDEDGDPKQFTFCSKDTPQKRAFWLEIIKTLETAIKLTPTK